VDRSQKEALVRSLKDSLQQASVVVVTRQSGLTVGEVTNLRRETKQADVGYKVVKNNLARRAIQGTEYESLSQYLTGPTAFAFSVDPVAAAKVVVKFSDTNEKLSVMGGMLAGKLMSAAEVGALAKLMSLDELRSCIVGILQAPAGKIARIMAEPGARVARVLNARA